MTSTEIDCEEITRILKQCGRSGVSKIKFKGLEVEFFSSEKLAETPKTKEPRWETGVSLSSQNNEIEDQGPKIMLNDEDREILREFDELQLAIDDPLAYEQAQMDEDAAIERVRGASERVDDRGSE